jgi:aminopeptidase N
MRALTSTRAPFVETVVYVPKGKAAQAEFACEVSVKALDFFQDLFACEYPLPVLSHIAIPDFA